MKNILGKIFLVLIVNILSICLIQANNLAYADLSSPGGWDCHGDLDSCTVSAGDSLGSCIEHNSCEQSSDPEYPCRLACETAYQLIMLICLDIFEGCRLETTPG